MSEYRVPENNQRMRLSEYRYLILCQAYGGGLSSQLSGRLRIKDQGLPELLHEFKASLQLCKTLT